MVLSNAERQKRYRQRLRRSASLDGLGSRARDAADQAIAALWAVIKRPDSDGRIDATGDGLETIADFRAQLAAAEKRGYDDLPGYCRSYLQTPEELTPDEVRALSVIIEIYEALTLAAECPERPKRGRNR